MADARQIFLSLGIFYLENLWIGSAEGAADLVNLWSPSPPVRKISVLKFRMCLRPYPVHTPEKTKRN